MAQQGHSQPQLNEDKSLSHLIQGEDWQDDESFLNSPEKYGGLLRFPDPTSFQQGDGNTNMPIKNMHGQQSHAPIDAMLWFGAQKGSGGGVVAVDSDSFSTSVGSGSLGSSYSMPACGPGNSRQSWLSGMSSSSISGSSEMHGHLSASLGHVDRMNQQFCSAGQQRQGGGRAQGVGGGALNPMHSGISNHAVAYRNAGLTSFSSYLGGQSSSAFSGSGVSDATEWCAERHASESVERDFKCQARSMDLSTTSARSCASSKCRGTVSGSSLSQDSQGCMSMSPPHIALSPSGISHGLLTLIGVPVSRHFDSRRSSPFDLSKFDRRDPHLHFYIPVDCPYGRRCSDGKCPLAHTKLEKIFHPIVYRTQTCQMALTGRCEYLHKCAFYHTEKDKQEAELHWRLWEAEWYPWRQQIDERLLSHNKLEKEIRRKVEGIMKIRMPRGAGGGVNSQLSRVSASNEGTATVCGGLGVDAASRGVDLCQSSKPTIRMRASRGVDAGAANALAASVRGVHGAWQATIGNKQQQQQRHGACGGVIMQRATDGHCLGMGGDISDINVEVQTGERLGTDSERRLLGGDGADSCMRRGGSGQASEQVLAGALGGLINSFNFGQQLAFFQENDEEGTFSGDIRHHYGAEAIREVNVNTLNVDGTWGSAMGAAGIDFGNGGDGMKYRSTPNDGLKGNGGGQRKWIGGSQILGQDRATSMSGEERAEYVRKVVAGFQGQDAAVVNQHFQNQLHQQRFHQRQQQLQSQQPQTLGVMVEGFESMTGASGVGGLQVCSENIESDRADRAGQGIHLSMFACLDSYPSSVGERSDGVASVDAETQFRRQAAAALLQDGTGRVFSDLAWMHTSGGNNSDLVDLSFLKHDQAGQLPMTARTGVGGNTLSGNGGSRQDSRKFQALVPSCKNSAADHVGRSAGGSCYVGGPRGADVVGDHGMNVARNVLKRDEEEYSAAKTIGLGRSSDVNCELRDAGGVVEGPSRQNGCINSSGGCSDNNRGELKLPKHGEKCGNIGGDGDTTGSCMQRRPGSIQYYIRNGARCTSEDGEVALQNCVGVITEETVGDGTSEGVTQGATERCEGKASSVTTTESGGEVSETSSRESNKECRSSVPEVIEPLQYSQERFGTHQWISLETTHSDSSRQVSSGTGGGDVCVNAGGSVDALRQTAGGRGVAGGSGSSDRCMKCGEGKVGIQNLSRCDDVKDCDGGSSFEGVSSKDFGGGNTSMLCSYKNGGTGEYGLGECLPHAQQERVMQIVQHRQRQDLTGQRRRYETHLPQCGGSGVIEDVSCVAGGGDDFFYCHGDCDSGSGLYVKETNTNDAEVCAGLNWQDLPRSELRAFNDSIRSLLLAATKKVSRIDKNLYMDINDSNDDRSGFYRSDSANVNANEIAGCIDKSSNLPAVDFVREHFERLALSGVSVSDESIQSNEGGSKNPKA